ncbi:replication factor RFC1 C terminal domain-containing protein [Chlamydoabsidia padenii]|nr:replication factor RFC1 C terminal domain-containing protein [Chlamydoabsidia padenii]
MAGITQFFKPAPKKDTKEEPQRKKRIIEISEDEDDGSESVAQPAKKKAKAQSESSSYFDGKKGTCDTKAIPVKQEIKEGGDGGDIVMSQRKRTAKAPTKTATKTKAATKTKSNVKDEDEDFAPIEDTKSSTTEKKPSKRAGFYNMMHRAPPSALGSRPKPVGKSGCLAGMTFVLSGEFETITKEDISDIIKTYGGRVTSAVSGKTTYLLRGRDAGESKLAKAKSLKTKIMDEDGFYDIVQSSTGDTQSSGAPVEPVKSIAAKPTSKAKAPVRKQTESMAGNTSGDTLWTEKYKPKSIGGIIGNKSSVEKLSTWLAEWQSNLKKGFPDSGEGMSSYRSVLISGPPGVGKTTASQILAKEHGYKVLEYNASDTRNKKILEELISETTFNRSMTEFFQSDASVKGAKTKKSSSVNGKVVLIMDEVDGMSGGDRGGSAELARLIRSTKVPIICVCNDSRSDKVKPLLKVCFETKFTRTPARSLRPMLMKIAEKEHLQIEPNALDELVSLTGNDIRQIINILSTYRLSSDDMKYGDAKTIGTQNQKYSQISLFDIPLKLLSGSAWHHPVINQLSDVYFHDYSLANLMVYENYTKSSPTKARKWNTTGNPKETECLEMDLIAKAANAITEGDLVDHRISRKQEYSLMPVHSVLSCVRPAYYAEGSLAGNRIGFPLWLGQNSKTTKNKRLLANVQNKLRTKATVDLSEVRQHYVPALTVNLFTDIMNGQYDKAMDTMDFYYLDRENLETLSDLALTPKSGMDALNANAKRNFNKAYKKRSHPMLFELSDTKPLKSKSKAPAEDLEGVIFNVEPSVDETDDDE